MRITASDVAARTAGTLCGDDATADGIGFDSRTDIEGRAFFALTGERDGHEFVGAAFAGGASFAVVSRGRALRGRTCVEVDDPMAAITVVGQMCRERLSATANGRVVAVTGSAGKTSTKDFARAVLASTFRNVHGSHRSFNNDIGVPVTLAGAADDCEALVVEMGMRGHGEIARLCTVARPDIGIVTLVGDAHADRVGGIDGVAAAKGELIECIGRDGTAVLNADDPRVAAMVSRTKGRVITFGSAAGSSVRFTIVGADDFGRCTADFAHSGSVARAVLAVPGAHMVANAAAAVAAGIATGIDLATCVAALAGVETADQRVRWRTLPGGIHVLDDTYNANSSSMAAALQTLRASRAGHHVAVLGEMAEISDPAASHRWVWQFACDLDIDVIALETDLYGPGGVSVDEAVSRVLGNGPGTAVLVKGSRASRTERVVEALARRQST